MQNLYPLFDNLLKLRIVWSFIALFSLSSLSFADDVKTKPDRGPKSLGSVLIFSGTGWYRHPEVAAVNGWLVRTCSEQGIQADVSETPMDLEKRLSNYTVLVFNNTTSLSEILDEK